MIFIIEEKNDKKNEIKDKNIEENINLQNIFQKSKEEESKIIISIKQFLF